MGKQQGEGKLPSLEELGLSNNSKMPSLDDLGLGKPQGVSSKGLKNTSTIFTKPSQPSQASTNNFQQPSVYPTDKNVNVLTGEKYTQPKANKPTKEIPSLYQDALDAISSPIKTSATLLTRGMRATADAVFGKPTKTVDDFISQAKETEPKAPSKLKYDANYLQKISESVDANKFADNIEKSGEPNSKQIAQGVRERNKQWFELPVKEREAIRDFNSQQDEEKNVSDLNSFNIEQQRLNGEIVAENERLKNTVSFVGSDNDFAKINSLNRRLDELKVKKGYLELKPSVIKSSIFKDDKEIIQNLGGELNQVFENMKINDPSRYEGLQKQTLNEASSLGLYGLSDKDRRDLINSALSIKNNKLQEDINELYRLGGDHLATDYLEEVKAFRTAVESGDENAIISQQRVLQGYKDRGVDDALSMINDISKQEENISDIIKSSSVKYDILHDQKKQKEVDDFVKDNPFLGRVWEFTKSAYSVLPKTFKLGTEVGRNIVNIATLDPEHDRKSAGYPMINQLVDVITPRMAKLDLLKTNEDVEWGNVVNVIGEQVATMATLLSGGGRIGGALKSLGVGAKVAASTGLMASSFALSKGDYYNNAINNGLKSKDATAFANQSAILTSVLELISPNDMILTGEVKSAITKEFAKYFIKGGMKYALIQSGKRIVIEAGLKELPQEISQLLGDKFLELAYNRVKGTKFNENITHNSLKQTVIGTLATTSILTAARNRSINNQERQQYLYEASKDMPALKITLDEMKLSQEDVKKVMIAATAYRKAYDATPAGLDEKIKGNVAPLLVSKQKLQQEALAENLDPAFKTAINERIKIIDNAIIGITNGTLDPKKVNISDDPIEAVKNTEENIKNGTNITKEVGLEEGKENLDAFAEEIKPSEAVTTKSEVITPTEEVISTEPIKPTENDKLPTNNTQSQIQGGIQPVKDEVVPIKVEDAKTTPIQNVEEVAGDVKTIKITEELLDFNSIKKDRIAQAKEKYKNTTDNELETLFDDTSDTDAEYELERRERGKVFETPLSELDKVIDDLIQKEKKGNGTFSDISDLRRAKEIVSDYTKDKDTYADSEIKKDFRKALFGNPKTSYADGLLLRESMNLASERGIKIDDLLKEVESVFTKDGYSPEIAKQTIFGMLKDVFEGSKEVNEKQIAEQSLPNQQDKSSSQGIEKSNLDLDFIADKDIPKETVDAYNKKGKLAGTTEVPNEKILNKQNEIKKNLETLKKFTKCLTT